MDQEDGIVRMEVDELTKYIEDTVTSMIEKNDVVEKLDDYDRLLKEATEMRKKIEALEAEAKANAKALAAQPQTTMKSEGEDEDEEDDKKDKKPEFPPKKDDKKEKKDDEEEEAEKSEAELKVETLEAEVKELKESPLYKAQQGEVPVEAPNTPPATGLLNSIIKTHFGGE